MYALLVIDMQEDFVATPGLSGQRTSLVAGVNQWVAWAHGRGFPVIEVHTVLPQDRSAWALNMREDDHPMVIEDTPGAARLAEFEFVPDRVIAKTRDDAFHRTPLIETLRDLDIDSLVIAGVSTEACVAVTAASAYAWDLPTSLAAGAFGSADARAHSHAVGWLHKQYRQDVVSPEDLSW